MDKLSDLASKIAKKHDLKGEMDAAFILEKTREIIRFFWGEKGLKNLKPQKIIFNKLYIQANNSVWAQEIQLKKFEILKILEEKKIKHILEIKIIL